MKTRFIIYAFLSEIFCTPSYNLTTTGLIKHCTSQPTSDSKKEIRSINWKLERTSDSAKFPNNLLTSAILYPTLERSFFKDFSLSSWYVGVLEYDLSDIWTFSDNKAIRYYVSLGEESGDNYSTKHFVTNTVEVLRYLIVKITEESLKIFREQFSDDMELFFLGIEECKCIEEKHYEVFDDLLSFKESITDFLLNNYDKNLESMLTVNTLFTFIQHYKEKTKECVKFDSKREDYISLFEYARTISKVLFEVSSKKNNISDFYKKLHNYDVCPQDNIIITKAIYLCFNEHIFLPDLFSIKLLGKENKVLYVENDIMFSKKTIVIEVEDIKKIGIEYLRIVTDNKEIDINIRELSEVKL